MTYLITAEEVAKRTLDDVILANALQKFNLSLRQMTKDDEDSCVFIDSRLSEEGELKLIKMLKAQGYSVAYEKNSYTGYHCVTVTWANPSSPTADKIKID